MRRLDEPNRGNDNARPRHIRDIAHLYMSRRKAPQTEQGPPSIHIYVTSGDAGCISGFHVANLASAFAQRKALVRVFELSGRLPNTSYYFGHPTPLYMNMTGHGHQKMLPALPGVSIAFDTGARPRPHDGDGPIVSIYHLPLTDDESAWDRIGDSLKTQGWCVHLTGGGMVSMTKADRLPVHGTFYVGVGDGDHGVDGESMLGSIDDWRWALVDRMPVVVRDPASRLARTYLATCETLLARMVARKRAAHVETEQRAIASGRTRR